MYCQTKKIASLGLRIRQGCSYHGLALNVDMDLQPFHRINPCGYPDLTMTQIADFVPQPDLDLIQARLSHYLLSNLRYNEVVYHTQITSPT